MLPAPIFKEAALWLGYRFAMAISPMHFNCCAHIGPDSGSTSQARPSPGASNLAEPEEKQNECWRVAAIQPQRTNDLELLDSKGNIILSAHGLASNAVVAYAPAGPINVSVSTGGSTALISVNSVTFYLSVTTNVLTWANFIVFRTDANAGSNQVNVGLQFDGQYNSGSPFGDLSGDLFPINLPASLGNFAATLPGFQQILWRGVTPGTHTLALTAQATATQGVFSVGGSPALMTLGGAVGG